MHNLDQMREAIVGTYTTMGMSPEDAETLVLTIEKVVDRVALDVAATIEHACTALPADHRLSAAVLAMQLVPAHLTLLNDLAIKQLVADGVEASFTSFPGAPANG